MRNAHNMHNMVTNHSVPNKMPIFNPFSSKAKAGQPKKRTSNKEEMSYKSNDEDMLTHLENLQLEVSRLHQQLASIQSQQYQVRVKEEVSTQKSHQTFSTIGTTQPNHSSGSNPRPSSKQVPSPRFHDRHKADSNYSTRDRPPPVTQIFIPTPSISCHTSASYSKHSDYYNDRSIPDQAIWMMDDGRLSPQQHYQATDIDLGDNYNAVPRYVRTREIPAELLVPKQRNHSGPVWQGHHSTTHSPGPTGHNSTNHIRVAKTVKRIPTESSSATNTRGCPTFKKSFDHPMPLNTTGGHIHGPKTVNRVHRYDNGDQTLLSYNKGQHHAVWTPTDLPEEDSLVSWNDKVYQVEGHRVKQYPQPPYQKVRYKTRESSNSQSYRCNLIGEASSQEPTRPLKHSAKCIPPGLSSTTYKGRLDKNLLLSQIRNQRLHLKPASDRPEKPPLPKDDVGKIFEAIQNGVKLKRIDKPIKKSNEQNKSQPNAMLLQLQERKKAVTQYERVE